MKLFDESSIVLIVILGIAVVMAISTFCMEKRSREHEEIRNQQNAHIDIEDLMPR